jgi:hypothetical protein
VLQPIAAWLTGPSPACQAHDQASGHRQRAPCTRSPCVDAVRAGTVTSPTLTQRQRRCRTSRGKMVTGPQPTWRRSTVDHGHRLGEGSPENGQNGIPVRETSPRLRKNEEGTEVSLTGCKRGRRRVGHDRVTVGNDRWRRRSVEWALRTRKQAIVGEVSVVMARGCSSSFYSGRGGAHRGGGGGNSRR